MTRNNALTVVKDNQIVEASYALTLAEQRVLLTCIAQIDSKSQLLPTHEFYVAASDIVDLAGVGQGNAYRELRKAIDKLYSRSIKLNSHGGEIRWIYKKDYVDGEGRGCLSFSPDIIPYLSQLSQKFTAYKLKYVSSFKSSYSIRLYELLVQWTSKGEREVEVEWLKDIFQITHKYKSIRDLKNRVIEPAIADINEHSNLWCDYGQRKTGRVVTHIQFKFGLKAEEQPSPKSKFITEEQIKNAARPGETRTQVINRLNGQDLSKVAKPGETIEQVKKRKKALADINKAVGRSKPS